jgi:hypothetical protein
MAADTRFRQAHYCRKSISFHDQPRDKNYYSSPELTFEQTLLISLWLKNSKQVTRDCGKWSANIKLLVLNETHNMYVHKTDIGSTLFLSNELLFG